MTLREVPSSNQLLLEGTSNLGIQCSAFRMCTRQPAIHHRRQNGILVADFQWRRRGDGLDATSRPRCPPPNRYQTMTVCCSPTTLENTNNFTPVVSDKTRLIENRTANLDWIWLFVPIKIMTAHKSLLPHVTIRIIAVSAWRFREGGEILTRRLGEMSTGVRVRVSRRKFGKGITY
jgi:hypothetical protein